MRRLVLASANPQKVIELTDLMAGSFEVLPRPAAAPETIEDRNSLLGNALKKAEEIAQFAGVAALADDTGLFVNALNGEPGVYSARYAGPEADPEANVAKLLAELKHAEDRSAYFETVIAFVWPDGRQVVARGQVDGQIGRSAIGHGGFGYDPVFIPNEGDGRSFAQMSIAEKGSISHRARALSNLSTELSVMEF